MPSPSSRVHERLRALFVTNNIPMPEMSVESESLPLLLEIVSNSEALTFTAHSTLDLREGAEVVMLKIPSFAATRQAGIIAREGAWQSPAAKAVSEQLRILCEGNPHV